MIFCYKHKKSLNSITYYFRILTFKTSTRIINTNAKIVVAPKKVGIIIDVGFVGDNEVGMTDLVG